MAKAKDRKRQIQRQWESETVTSEIMRQRDRETVRWRDCETVRQRDSERKKRWDNDTVR